MSLAWTSSGKKDLNMPLNVFSLRLIFSHKALKLKDVKSAQIRPSPAKTWPSGAS